MQYLSYWNEPEEEDDENGNVVLCRSKKNRVGPLESEDWDKVEMFMNVLRVFYNVT